MSVLAYTPSGRTKRSLFLGEDAQENEQPDALHKRSRCCSSSPAAARFTSKAGSPAAWPGRHPGVHPDVLGALKGLFPHMDDQTLSNVLAECGTDIDAAIRRLNQLRLVGDAATAAAASSSAAQQQAAASATSGGSAPGTGAASSRADTPGPGQRQEQQQQQQEPPAAQQGPQTAEQWTEALVAEMSAARDMADAKQRAAKALTAFEQFVTARVAAQQHGGGSGAAAAAPRLEELQRENAILKRAVQIQNARMQELAARDADVAELKQAVAHYQEQLRQAELQKYSLAVHLRQATDGSALHPGQRPPDVF